MRPGTIWNVIRDDWYEHRRMIGGCLFIPLLLEVLVMWQGTLIDAWFQEILGVDKMIVTILVSVLLVSFPYILLHIFALTRLSSEADAGFYGFIRKLPVTAGELVTARFISSFVLSVGGVFWFALLLGLYGQGYGQPFAFELWTAIYLNAFIFSGSLAIYHGLFFRSGAKGTASAYILLFLLIIGMRSNFAERRVQTFNSALHDYPVITIGIGAVLLIVIWLLCWRWAMTTYPMYLEGTLKSAKKRRKRRATE